MRINKVEELVGITKKNIRFYEDKGLLTPERNAENGYREYSDADVAMLQKIKLLRQLSIPIEEILKLQQGILTLDDCMKNHIIFLEQEQDNLDEKKTICASLEASNEHFSTLDAEKYLFIMQQKEQEGVRFVNIKAVDKKKSAPIIAAGFMIIMMIFTIILLLWASTVDSIPLILLLLFLSFPSAIIVGVLFALKERMKQIDGGEEDEASKY